MPIQFNFTAKLNQTLRNQWQYYLSIIFTSANKEVIATLFPLKKERKQEKSNAQSHPFRCERAKVYCLKIHVN